MRAKRFLPMAGRVLTIGDDGEIMYLNNAGNYVCGGKKFSFGCTCEDCTEIANMKYEQMRDDYDR